MGKELSFQKQIEYGCVEVERSECGKYQYLTQLTLGSGSKGCCTVIGLLPPVVSDADQSKLDQVMRISADFASRLGYSKLNLVNLFAIRPSSESPENLVLDAIGPENNQWILKAASESSLIICAWGSYSRIGPRAYAVLDLLKDFDLYCVQTTKRGFPAHPLSWKKSIPKIYRLKVKKELQKAG